MEKISIINLIDKPISGEWGNDSIDNVGVKVIRTANFTNLGILNTDNIVIRDIEEAKIQSKKLIKGDTIIEKSGGSPTQPVGRVIYFNEDDLYLTNNFTSILRPKKEIIYPKFLFYSLFNLHKNGRTLKHQNKTTGIINLKLTEYLKEEIPLPSYADQIRIANILGKIEEVIQARKNAIDQLDELVKATFYDMFGDPVRNEKGWEKKPLNYLGNLDRGVSKHRPRNAPELLGGKYPLVQTGDVTRAGLWLKEYQQTYSELGLKQSKMWPSGTLLITIAANIAQTSILTFDSCFPDSVVGFTPYKGRANTIFIHYLLSFYQESLEKNAPQSAQKNINLGVLRELESIAPDLILQNQFAIIAEKIENLKAEQEKQLLEMEALYASVSHAAFSGTLDLSRIPYDERFLPVMETEREPVVIDKKKKEEILTPLPSERIEQPKSSFKGLTWDKVSFEQVASYIKLNYEGYYFSPEMLLNLLNNELGIQVYYFTSAEAKKNPQLLDADDFYTFVQSALTGNNPFLDLEQVFYNAEEENIKIISFRENDLELLAKKQKKERSGIYFRIKNETTTR